MVNDTTIQLTMNTPLNGSSFGVGANGFSVSGSTTPQAIYTAGVITITGIGFTRDATVSYSGISILDSNDKPIPAFSFQPFADLINQAPPIVADLLYLTPLK